MDDADEMIREIADAPAAKANGIDKIRYTHADMIDFIIAHPQISQGALALRYGYTQSWVSLVMSSDAFKSALAARRAELVDPTLVATINERFEAVTRLSLERLQEKLEKPNVSDATVLKAVELGAKAMGVGGNAATPPPPSGDHLAQLAQRLVALQANVRKGAVYEGTSVEVLGSES